MKNIFLNFFYSNVSEGILLSECLSRNSVYSISFLFILAPLDHLYDVLIHLRAKTFLSQRAYKRSKVSISRMPVYTSLCLEDVFDHVFVLIDQMFCILYPNNFASLMHI